MSSVLQALKEGTHITVGGGVASTIGVSIGQEHGSLHEEGYHNQGHQRYDDLAGTDTACSPILEGACADGRGDEEVGKDRGRREVVEALKEAPLLICCGRLQRQYR